MTSKSRKKHANRKSITQKKVPASEDHIVEPEPTFCSRCTKILPLFTEQDAMSCLVTPGRTFCLGQWEDDGAGPCSLCKAFRCIRGDDSKDQKYYVHAVRAAQIVYGHSVRELEGKVAPEHYPSSFEDSVVFTLIADRPRPIVMAHATKYAMSKDFLVPCCPGESDVVRYVDTSRYDHSHELWISKYENMSRSTKSEWRQTSIRAAINQAAAMGFIYEVRVDEDDTTYGRPIRPVTKYELEKRLGEGIRHVYATVLQPFEMGARDMPCTPGYVPQSVRERSFLQIQDLNTNAFSGRVVNRKRIDYSLLRAWVTQCRTTCDLDKFVRDQKRFGQIHFCLVDVFSREIVEIDAKRQMKYVALSYVWGGVRTEPQLDDWEALPTLPKRCVRVVDDALIVVKELGFRYLWVDSYCISKDSAQRHNQIANMDLVYKNAELTIVAAAGHDAEYGLPGVVAVLTKVSSNKSDLSEQSHATSYLARGWTYQEFFFSRRRLIFTNFQTSFECQHRCHALRQQESLSCPPQKLFADAVAADGGPRDFAAKDLYLSRTPRKHPNILYHADGASEVLDHDLILPKCSSLEIFEFHVREYTQRQLSFDEDALRAVGSILNKFANGNYIVYHLQGLPYNPSWLPEGESIRCGLLWTHGPSKTPMRRRPGFPSWSWTGWEGGVSWLPHSLYMRQRTEGHLEQAAIFKVVRRLREGHDKLVKVDAWHFFENAYVHPTELHFSSCLMELLLCSHQVKDSGDLAVNLDWLGPAARLHITRVAPTAADFKERTFYGILLRWVRYL